MKDFNKSTKKRLAYVSMFAIALFLLLILRLGYLQIIKGEELKRGALSESTRGITIKPKRGDILDRNGKKVAVSKISSTAWLDVSLVDKDKAGQVSKDLSKILELDQEEIEEKLKKNSGHEKLKQGLSDEEVVALRELNLRAIQIVDDFKRYYPYGRFASHVIGFTDIDNNGLYGIESTYDDYLSGSPGKWVKSTDVVGRQLPFDGDRLFNANDGYSVVLTIDETIQKLAENAVDQAIRENGAKNITVIAMEPQSGEILALVNKPDYDLNEPRNKPDKMSQERWEGLSPEERLEENYKMWRNYAINDIYEPGSTFKLVTAAAAIEENKVNPNTGFYCNGFIRDIKGVELKCSSWYNPHRNISFQQGMDSSCNIVFVNTARRLGKSSFLKYIKAFGFGEKTGIDLNGEEYGLVPNNPESVMDVQLATMSYGHGVAATPLQMANAVATVSNGGNLMKPRLVKEIRDSHGNVVEKFEPEVRRKVLSEETSQTMLGLMETVVSKGSGKKAYIDGFKIGGKTGTAEKVVDGVYVKGKYIGSFAAIAPVENPQIAMLVIVDDPDGVYYGGTTAAPIAKQIIEGTLGYLDIDEAVLDEVKKNQEIVTVPDVRNMPLSEAGIILSEKGLRHMTEYTSLDSNTIVVSQDPEPGIKLEKGSIIDLGLDQGEKEKVLMPDLIGKDREEIEGIIKSLGIKLTLEIEGEGVCKKQEPEPEVEIEENNTLKILLE